MKLEKKSKSQYIAVLYEFDINKDYISNSSEHNSPFLISNCGGKFSIRVEGALCCGLICDMLANFDLTTAIQFDIKEMYPGMNAHRESKIIDKGSVVSYKFLCMIVVFIFCFLFKVDGGRYDNSEKFKYRASG